MTAFTEPPSSRTTLTTSALNSLASTNYVVAGTIDVSAVDPDDVVVEVEVTPGTVSSSKQVSVWAQVSFDNINFSTGPTSGAAASTNDEPNLYPLGAVPCNTNSTLQRKAFSVMAQLGFVPPYLKIICKNETGAALAASGHGVYYATYTGLGT